MVVLTDTIKFNFPSVYSSDLPVDDVFDGIGSIRP